MIEISQTQLTRFDKNITEELSVFNTYDDDFEKNLSVGLTSTLTKHLFFYFAHKYQTSPKDLFNKFILDVDEFCKVTGYMKNKLQVSHPSPTHLRLLTQNRTDIVAFQQEGHSIWTSIIENALYRMLVQPLVFSSAYRYVDSEGNTRTQASLRSLSIIKDLDVCTVKSRNGKLKKTYKIALSEEMCNNFTRFFTKADYNTIASLRKHQLDDMYVFLQAARSKINFEVTNRTTAHSFSKLCQVAGVNNIQPARNKITLTRKIDLINELTDLKVAVEWKTSKDDNRVQYTPELIFGEPATVIAADTNYQRLELLYTNFVKALMEQTKIVFVRNSTKEQLFQSNDYVDADILEFLTTCDPKRIVDRNLNLNWRTAVEMAYLKAQGITFGPHSPSTLEGVKKVYSKLTAAKDKEHIIEILSTNYLAKK